MDLMPDTMDAAAVADRIRPLAQQASEGLRHTSEGLRHTSESLRQGLEQAREAIADRIEIEAPAFSLEPPAAAVALAARDLPFLRREPPRRELGNVQWLLLALAMAGAAMLAAFAVTVIVQRRAEQRRRSSLPAVAPRSAVATQSETVTIPVSPMQQDRSGDLGAGAGTAGSAEVGTSQGPTEGNEDASVPAAVEAAAGSGADPVGERSDQPG